MFLPPIRELKNVALCRFKEALNELKKSSFLVCVPKNKDVLTPYISFAGLIDPRIGNKNVLFYILRSSIF